MLEVPYLDNSTTAQKQGTTLPLADVQTQLAAALQEIASLRAQLAASKQENATKDQIIADQQKVISTKDQIIADQQKVIAGQKVRLDEAEVFRQNVLKERTYLRRGDIDPTTKLTAVIAAWELGITFGNDNIERPQSHKKITAEKVAGQVGVSTAVAMGRLNALTTPVPGFTAYFQKEKVWKKQQETGKPFSFNQLAGPEGVSWAKTWGGDPLQMPVPPPSPRQQQNREHQRAKSAEQRAVVAEARRILAQCPHCGSHEVSLLCHNCGAKTTAKEALPASSTGRADSALSHINPRFGDDGTAATGGESGDAPPTAEAPSPKRKPRSDSAENIVLCNEDLPYRVCNETAESALSHSNPCFGDDPPEDSAPPRTNEQPARCTAQDVTHLTGGDHALAGVLAQATNTLMGAVGDYPNHLVMQRRTVETGSKYLTVPEPLTHLGVAEHLVGSTTLGAGLLTVQEDEGGHRACRAVAYDSDKAFGTLVAAAKKLADHGLTPLLVRNSAKHASGHLWVLFDRDVDPASVFTTLETWAPMLAKVTERFPAPQVRGGHRLRLPGGCYLPVGVDPVPVQVALVPATGEGDIEWVDALGPDAWVLIGACVTPAASLEHAWIAPDSRPRPTPPPRPKRTVTPAGTHAADTSIDEAVARFNAEHSVASLVDVNRAGIFRSPWHTDGTPSCKRYEGDRWTDFSRDNHGGDALSLYCALNGLWPEGQEKPDRLKALRSLGYLPERKDGYHPEIRGDALLVRITIADTAKFHRAKESFKAAFRPVRYSAADKAWVLRATQLEAANAWARSFAQSEGGAS